MNPGQPIPRHSHSTRGSYSLQATASFRASVAGTAVDISGLAHLRARRSRKTSRAGQTPCKVTGGLTQSFVHAAAFTVSFRMVDDIGSLLLPYQVLPALGSVAGKSSGHQREVGAGRFALLRRGHGARFHLVMYLLS